MIATILTIAGALAAIAVVYAAVTLLAAAVIIAATEPRQSRTTNPRREHDRHRRT